VASGIIEGWSSVAWWKWNNAISPWLHANGLNNLRALPFVVPSCRFGVHKRAKKPRYALKVPDAVEYG
jgi:hypothetical protein